MKKISTVFSILLALSLSVSAQVSDSSKTRIKADTAKFSWGKSKILIIGEAEGSDTITFERHRNKQRWNHFAGIDLGVNGFLTENNSVDLQREGQFMDLNYRKSLSLAINFCEWYIPVVKEKIGFSTGLGFEFNNYDLDRDVTILTNKDTTIGVSNDNRTIEKNRFKSTMLNLPLFLETNIGRDAEHSFHIAVGGQVSYRVGSKTKQIYEEDEKDYKVKNRTDFNMNDFRFNAVARVGYGDFTLFASYSLTPMFDKDKGPELYPFTVGISLVSF